MLGTGPIAVDQLAQALRQALGERDASLMQLPLSWNGASWPFRHPLDYLGSDGGGGIGSGPGLSVGSALALKDSGRLPVSEVPPPPADLRTGALCAQWRRTVPRVPAELR